MTAILPKVSIITVVRNAAALLEKTIRSVAAQDYPHIEYVVVDGLSTDDTPQVIERCREHISLTVSEKDKNLYDAMNKGLRLASGDFIWYLHAGDLIPEADTLSRVMQKYASEDFIYGDAVRVQPDGSNKPWHKQKPLPQNFSYRSFAEGMVVCHQSMIVRRSITPFYDLRYSLVGDLDWTVRLLKEAKACRDTELTLCRFLDGGISTKHKRASLKERFKIIQQHFGLFKALGAHLKIVIDRITR